MLELVFANSLTAAKRKTIKDVINIVQNDRSILSGNLNLYSLNLYNKQRNKYHRCINSACLILDSYTDSEAEEIQRRRATVRGQQSVRVACGTRWILVYSV